MRIALQEVLEAEMTETVGAAKVERTDESGDRSVRRQRRANPVRAPPGTVLHACHWRTHHRGQSAPDPHEIWLGLRWAQLLALSFSLTFV